jgi:mycothiol maleylpyruvate isomerase-like protein
MTGRREELLRVETEGWERLTGLVDGLGERELDAPGVTPEGWSVKDVAWHVAAWSRDTARVLREMAAGTWDGSDPSLEPDWTDRTNAAWFERSRTMPPVEALAELRDAREDLLAAFGELRELTPDADEWFEETAPIHYAKHLADLELWVASLHDGDR